MIKAILNQVVCKNCMTKLEYESSDVKQTITKYPNIEFEPNGRWVINGFVKVAHKHIECPICKAKVKL